MFIYAKVGSTEKIAVSGLIDPEKFLKADGKWELVGSFDIQTQGIRYDDGLMFNEGDDLRLEEIIGIPQEIPNPYTMPSMDRLAKLVGHFLNSDYRKRKKTVGFSIQVYPLDKEGTVAYISNANPNETVAPLLQVVTSILGPELTKATIRKNNRINSKLNGNRK